MIRIAKPEVFLVGQTVINVPGLTAYLAKTGNLEFLETIAEARAEGLGDMEVLSSFFAKLCYRSLTSGKNDNVSKMRSIRDNIIGTIESGHGSVFEHAVLNFVLSDVSRVLTHELVRHRVSVAYSQESGRYCRLSPTNTGIYIPPEIAGNPEAEVLFVNAAEQALVTVAQLYDAFGIDEFNFHTKKQLTSAIRRIAPTGIANEIGFSVNLRAVRHIITMRTNRGAEREIRLVFGQLANIVKDICPLLFHGGECVDVDGLPEWTFPKHL
ncbi:MAG: FAD-dependent thymidylate synthase [Patescibacteria group bacterium]|jgi:thymidylate synthase (FAD)